MPHYFHFRAETADFDAELITERCSYVKENHSRCKNRVSIGLDLCWQHTRKQYHIRVGKSNIPHAGNGLFAYNPVLGENDIVFRANDFICLYNGETINEAEVEERYGENNTAPYTFKVQKDVFEDAAISRGIGSLINNSRNSGHRNNCRITSYRGRARIKATQSIRNNMELLVCYGNAYRFEEEGVESSTNGRKYTV